MGRGRWLEYLLGHDRVLGRRDLAVRPTSQYRRAHAGAAFGDGIALKAAGWSGGFEDDAEVLAIDCPGGPIPTPTATGVNPTATNTAVPPTSTATGGATSIRLGTLESSGTSTPSLFLALAGIAGLAGAAWMGARRR